MLECQKNLFQLPEHKTYLNCSYMSPMLKSVEESGMRGLRLKRDPTEIGHKEFFEDSSTLRRLFAKLIGASVANQVAIIPSVSYGLASAANSIPVVKGSNIIMAHEQFPSNVYIWQRLAEERNANLRVVKPDTPVPPKSKSWNKNILRSIDSNTSVVALSHVHWADGTLFDLEEIAIAVHSVGGYLIIDGTQSVGALPFDVGKIKPDALVVAGYKWLMGPYSIGLAWYSERLLQGNPIEENWLNRLNSEDFSRLVNYEPSYQAGAARYEVGERSNFILIPMMITALQQILEWRPERIQQYCGTIAADSIDNLKNYGYVIEPSQNNGRGNHLIGIYPNDPERIGTLQKQLADADISVSVRGDSIRVSPHLYNNIDDLEKLADILVKLEK